MPQLQARAKRPHGVLFEAMEHEEIRRTAIAALYADDVLAAAFTLKGGNALRLVHGIGPRTSLDVDVSTPTILDQEIVGPRLERSLSARFGQRGHIVFDYYFEPRPQAPQDPRQAGYEAGFKIAPLGLARSSGGDIARLRRESTTVGDAQQRVFKIQISAHEYCAGCVDVEFDGFIVRAYSLTMIAIEKYRALCQQQRSYSLRARKTPRARDFFDIVSILETGAVNLSSEPNKDLFRAIFAAKIVPLELLYRLPEEREYHRTDWAAVQQSVAGSALESFDFYFDRAIASIPRL